MFVIIVDANESNEDFTYHGKDHYFLSQEDTIEYKNIREHLNKIWDYYEYSSHEISQKVTELKDLRIYMGDGFFDFESTFKGNKVVEIPEDMYENFFYDIYDADHDFDY